MVVDPSRNNRRSACARDIHMPDASLIPPWYDRIRSPTRSPPWSVIEVSIEMGLCPGCIDLRRMQSWLSRIPIVVMLRHFVATCLNWNLTTHGKQSGKWHLNRHKRSNHAINMSFKKYNKSFKINWNSPIVLPAVMKINFASLSLVVGKIINVLYLYLVSEFIGKKKFLKY